ncbi:MAG: family 78 glycoside hydrolase catalytic domain [Opitutus sp.]
MRMSFVVSSLCLLTLNPPARAAASSDRTLDVVDLRCESLVSPALIDTPAPRFSWRLESTLRGSHQTAYQLRLSALTAENRPAGPALETRRITSDQSQWVSLPEFTARSKTRYQWQVRVWDNFDHDSGWSTATTFATSLLGEPWPATWISDGRAVTKKVAPPARYFRKTFDLAAAPVRARLYLSAFGLVEPWLNDHKVTEDLFLPGWPDYEHRNFYVAYDVTDQLRAGANTLGVLLGDGWYSGTLFLGHQYGPTPKFSGWLEITGPDGATRVVGTDGSWQWSEGAIQAQGIYFGETYDARRELAAWSSPTGTAGDWQPAVLEPAATVPLEAHYSRPVRRIQELIPITRREVRPGVFRYDLGQNMVGWVRLKVRAAAGETVQLRFAEMLDADGNAYTKNLRGAEATAHYTARGDGVETWEPRFTFFGFRYVELSGANAPLPDAVTGVVVHSDLARIGYFECSNPLLNQLYSNTLWGQKGNFLEIPTDCPQRDERLGWTGDAQVFCHTALYNLESGPFYRQWLAAVRDSFAGGKDGGFGGVAPYTGFQRGAAGWSDAGAIVPWITWLHTADRRVLEENFDAVQQWIALQAKSAPDGIRISKPGWGDWLAPGYEPKMAPTPYVLIATAYFAHSTEIGAKMADILGHPEIAAENRTLLAKIKAAFHKNFIADDGSVTSNEQTAYLLALGFDLVPDELRAQTVKHLEAAVAAKDNHLSTGFLGTPLLTPVLTEIGRPDLAYAVLLKETYPGWLFSVRNGATTIWERWDSWTPAEGFNKGGMNSFNHYAYGSVVGWFYDTIAGLKPDPDAPGWKHFTIAPTPGGGLTYAKAKLDTPYGLAASEWRIVDGHFETTILIPANTTATISLPAPSLADITEFGQPLHVAHPRAGDGRVHFELPAGEYHFVVRATP